MSGRPAVPRACMVDRSANRTAKFSWPVSRVDQQKGGQIKALSLVHTDQAGDAKTTQSPSDRCIQQRASVSEAPPLRRFRESIEQQRIPSVLLHLCLVHEPMTAAMQKCKVQARLIFNFDTITKNRRSALSSLFPFPCLSSLECTAPHRPKMNCKPSPRNQVRCWDCYDRILVVCRMNPLGQPA